MSTKRKLQIKIVFDTCVINNKLSESELLNHVIKEFIKNETSRKDVEISWYLPAVVIKERQHHMQEIAKTLLQPIEKLENLLGHKLGITSASLNQRVKECISKTMNEYKLTILPIDKLKVDWEKIIEQACSRIPPFSPGEKEKGFKDAMISESFFQFVKTQPPSSKNVKIIFVTDDGILFKYIEASIKEFKNAYVSRQDDLTGLINTFASHIDEVTIKQYQQLAGKYFFSKENKSCLYYREKISNSLKNKFKTELSSCQNIKECVRENEEWSIYSPQFVKKNRTRVEWVSKIEINFKISKIETYSTIFSPGNLLPTIFGSDYLKNHGALGLTSQVLPSLTGISELGKYTPIISSQFGERAASVTSPFLDESPQKKTIYTGKSVFEVIWDVNIDINKRLTRAEVKEIKYIETSLDDNLPA